MKVEVCVDAPGAPYSGNVGLAKIRPAYDFDPYNRAQQLALLRAMRLFGLNVRIQTLGGGGRG